jgi:antitoxin component of RelBE/YafQ-DinJ toxin-antitoxin module
MSTTTKTIGSRVNDEVHTLFTDVCNNEGITMSQKINQLVTDCVSFPSKTENKVEPEPLINKEKPIRVIDSKSSSRNSLDSFLNKLENNTKKQVMNDFVDSLSNRKIKQQIIKPMAKTGMKCLLRK